MNTENQRAAFEAWASTQQDYGTADNPVNDCLGATRNAWKVWQAALESPEVQALRNALEMIAGIRPCPDNLLGNVDIALMALEKQK